MEGCYLEVVDKSNRKTSSFLSSWKELVEQWRNVDLAMAPQL